MARTVVRRAERLVVSFPIEGSEVGRYLNRLSDLLWAMARYAEGDQHLLARRTEAGGSTVVVKIEILAAAPFHPIWWHWGYRSRQTSRVHAIGVSLDGEVGQNPVPSELDPVWCKRHGFTGKVGQTVTFRAAGANGTPQTTVDLSHAEIVLVGLGDRSLLDGDRGLESLRRASAAFVRAAGQGGSAALALPDVDIGVEQSAAAVAEGAVLASYRYDAYRTGDHPETLDGLVIVTGAVATSRRLAQAPPSGPGWPNR